MAHQSALLLLIAVCFLLASGCANIGTASATQPSGHHEDVASPARSRATAAPSVPSVPTFVKAEHEELHVGLASAMKSGGETGEAARQLHPHFLKEEQYALPPLGLLPGLASGELSIHSPEAEAAIEMADRLRTEYPQMLKEHAEVGSALRRLIAVGGSRE